MHSTPAPNTFPRNSPEVGAISYAALTVPLLLGVYLVLTSTVYLLPGMAVLDSKRVLEIALLTAIMVLAIASKEIRAAFTSQFLRMTYLVRFCTALFFFLGIVSAVINSKSLTNLAYSLADVALLVLMTITILIVAACRSLSGLHFDRLAIGLITLLGLAVGMQELIGTGVYWSIGTQFSYDWALTHFAHPRFYNQLQSWTVPAIAALPLLFPRSRTAKILCIIALGLHWYVLLLTGARGGVVSLVLALSAVALFSPEARNIIIKMQVPGIILGGAIYFSMFLGPQTGREPATAPTTAPPIQTEAHSPPQGNSMDERGKPTPNNSIQPNPFYELSLGRPMLHTSGRTRLWQEALTYTRESPLWGIGPMNYACHSRSVREAHPHSFYLQIVSEWGIPAAGSLLIILITLSKNLWRALRYTNKKSETSNAFPILLASSVLAGFILAGVDGVFILPASQIAACLMSGWLLGILPADPTGTSQIQSEAKLGTIIVLFLAVMVGLSLLAFSLREAAKMPVYQQLSHPRAIAYPRFWQLGNTCSLEP